ncbi:MAG TPA: hypothetical protein VJY15_09565 [Candidatus Acidoferrum sp.]|nr:hypothetical protein [Candidatus Acidoferrum sp.]
MNDTTKWLGLARKKTMFDLIEIELTRVRRMAEQTDDAFLIYLIDIAIIEANAKARSNRDALETVS